EDEIARLRPLLRVGNSPVWIRVRYCFLDISPPRGKLVSIFVPLKEVELVSKIGILDGRKRLVGCIVDTGKLPPSLMFPVCALDEYDVVPIYLPDRVHGTLTQLLPLADWPRGHGLTKEPIAHQLWLVRVARSNSVPEREITLLEFSVIPDPKVERRPPEGDEL